MNGRYQYRVQYRGGIQIKFDPWLGFALYPKGTDALSLAQSLHRVNSAYKSLLPVTQPKCREIKSLSWRKPSSLCGHRQGGTGSPHIHCSAMQQQGPCKQEAVCWLQNNAMAYCAVYLVYRSCLGVPAAGSGWGKSFTPAEIRHHLLSTHTMCQACCQGLKHSLSALCFL